jgi:microcystin-dependent protein
MEPFIGQIMAVGFNFAPRGWAYCRGQLMPIQQYSALFSLIGTYYGGDGRTTFALPNLQSRTAIGMGTGNGLSTYQIGQSGGEETNMISVNQMPPHNHGVALYAETALADNADPTGRLLGFGSGSDRIYAAPVAADEVAMASDSIRQQTVGGGLPVNNMMPYLAVNYIIALQGIYPSRN